MVGAIKKCSFCRWGQSNWCTKSPQRDGKDHACISAVSASDLEHISIPRRDAAGSDSRGGGAVGVVLLFTGVCYHGTAETSLG